MKISLILLSLTLTSVITPAQTAIDDPAKVKWLSKNAVSIASIDIHDNDFSDLQPLKKLIGDARVVQLGEQGHGDGATIYGKQRLIRFLHQQMGFDVLAWESGFFDCEEINRALASDMPVRDVATLGVFPIWSDGGLIAPLFEYSRTTLKNDRPLRVTGFDMQDFNHGSLNRLFELIDAIDPELVSPAGRKLMEGYWQATAPNYQPAKGEREGRMAAIQRSLDALARKAPAVKRPREIAFLRKAFENLAATEERALIQGGGVFGKALYRDRKMGETLVWLANEFYAGHKIITWAASSHVARNISTVDTRQSQFSYNGYTTMGDVVQRSLGTGVYTIGFTSYKGTAGTPWRPPAPLATPSAGSVESLLHATGRAYAFVDFKALPADHWLREPMLANVFVHREMRSNWTSNFDAILYIDLMFPSTK